MTALHSYNYLGEQTLCAIEQAMTKVWTSLQTSEPSVDWLKNGELRTLLANRLMDLAEPESPIPTNSAEGRNTF